MAASHSDGGHHGAPDEPLASSISVMSSREGLSRWPPGQRASCRDLGTIATASLEVALPLGDPTTEAGCLSRPTTEEVASLNTANLLLCRKSTHNDEADDLHERRTARKQVHLEMAIAVFLEGYFATCHRSSKTIRAYGLDLRQFLCFAGDKTALAGVSPEVLEAWATQLRESGYASASIRRKFASLRVFFRYWERRGTIERSPTWGLRLDLAPEVKLPVVLSLDEIQRLLGQARGELGPAPTSIKHSGDRTFLALRNVAMIEVLFATGIRVGELTSLTIRDIDIEGRQFVINGKGSRQRVARLVDDYSHEALVSYRDLRLSLLSTTDAFFLNLFGGRLSAQGVAYNLSRLATAAGIEKHVTPHMLRHTIATLLLRQGADLRVVQEFLGHSCITTTQRYTHISQEHLEQALRVCHPNLTSRSS